MRSIKKKTSVIVSDNTIAAEGLSKCSKMSGRISGKARKRLATNVMKNPGRAFEIGSKIVSASSSKSPEAA